MNPFSCMHCSSPFKPRRQRQRFCSRTCSGRGRARSKRSLADRLWEKVQKGSATECWPWRGVIAGGQGFVWTGIRLTEGSKGTEAVHRVVYRLVHGDFPRDLKVRHLCGTKICCNPEHLVLRSKSSAKLNGAQVIEARHRRARGETITQIAHDMGVARTTISRAVSGEGWSDIPMAAAS